MRSLDFVKSVPVQMGGSVLDGGVGHIGCSRISQRSIEDIAVEKYQSSGCGITFDDIIETFSVKKRKAQRSLKYFLKRGVLFTAQSLISQGILLVQNTSPQQYFPSCIKAEIIENLKKRENSVLVNPRGSTSQKLALINTFLPGVVYQAALRTKKLNRFWMC
jgi:hypothetical protein